MKLKYAVSAIAATMLMNGAAVADDGPKNKKQNRNAATSVSGGVAAADRRGAAAGGLSAAQSTRDARMNRRGMEGPNAASTSTTGAVYTDRRRGSAAINTTGSATGSGAVRSSSEGEVYSSTDRQGSQADAYGVSDAEAREPRRRTRDDD